MPSTWRELIAPAAAGRLPLALGLELRQRDAYDPARWEPRAVVTATARGLAARHDGLLLAARPLVPGSGGGWIRGDVSWDAVRRHPDRFEPAHARWFAELHGIAHDARATGGFAAVAEWLVLDESPSSLLWRHLAAAERTGVAVVSASRQQRFAFAEAATAGAEVSRDDSGGLRVTALVTMERRAVNAALVRPLGRTGVYAFALDRDPVPVTLAPVELAEPVAALLRAGGVSVPAEEAGDFVREAYPALARVAAVSARGIVLPDPSRPTLRLAVAFDESGRVAYGLSWSYPGAPAVPFAPDAADGASAAGRNGAAERALAARVERAWSAASALPFAPAADLGADDGLEFSVRVLPALERIDDVRIESTGARPVTRELAGDPAIRVTTVESADPDWFDLGIVVTIDGRRIPFGSLVSALARGRRRMRLQDGAWFSLAHPSLVRLKELLDEAAAHDEWQSGARLNRYQTSLWADFEDLAEEAEPAVAWRALVRGLVGDVETVELPSGVHATLRPYQHAGLDWLMYLWRNRLGGILADDMGLGKTVQTLAFLAAARAERAAGDDSPFLVVAPTSVLSSWQEQAARFAPGLDVRAVAATSARRAPLAEMARGTDVVLTSYAVLRLDEAEFARMRWAGVVLDEAQAVKNAATKLHRAVAALDTPTIVALTGTPIENGLGDLWALLALTAPGLFPSARRFREEFVQPIEQGRVPENIEGGPYRAARLERLRRRIRPFVLRRTKENVAADLPPRQEQELHVELSPEHRELYDTVLHRERQKVLGLLDDFERNRIVVFRSLTLLRLLSLAPELVDERHRAFGSAKLDALLDHLVEVAAEGHRALVFSQFTSFLDLVEQRLVAAGMAFERLDGTTTRRGDVIDAFRTGDAPVFLLSLKAGGVGLTLTEADYVFLLDPWWSPAAEAQAIDRTHRIGQQRSVFVYRLLAAGTIEQKVRELQRRKSRLFRAVLDDDALSRALTADDIRGLLES